MDRTPRPGCAPPELDCVREPLSSRNPNPPAAPASSFPGSSSPGRFMATKQTGVEGDACNKPCLFRPLGHCLRPVCAPVTCPEAISISACPRNDTCCGSRTIQHCDWPLQTPVRRVPSGPTSGPHQLRAFVDSIFVRRIRAVESQDVDP
jgi:hypothetical protein